VRIRWGAGALLAAAALAALAGGARGGGDAAGDLAALQKEFGESKLGYREKYLAFRERFERFAETHPKTEEGLTAKIWLLGNTWWHREEGTMEKRAAALADAILADFPDSKQLARIPDLHYDFSAPDRERIFGKLLASSPHAEVRASALLRLATTRKGPERKEMLERLRKEYGAVPFRCTTFGAMAEARLFPHDPAALEVGRPAPEIEGKDADGKPMRLSDYLGKVVVLDFFGDW